MKFLIMLALCGLAVALPSARQVNPDLDDEFQEWMFTYQKVYPNDAEELKRRLVWEDSHSFVTLHNSQALSKMPGSPSYMVELNSFADETAQEMELRKGFRADFIDPTASAGIEFEMPAVRKAEAKFFSLQDDQASPIRDQGACGTCYTFASVTALEYAYKKKHGVIKHFSNQQGTDCSKGQIIFGLALGNQGCKGGNMVNMWNYYKSKQKAKHEHDYPYTATDNTTCKYVASLGVFNTVSHVTLNTEDKVLAAIDSGIAVSIGFDANGPFNAYKSGIYYNAACSSTQLNHAVVVIGYGEENGQKYWIVKNSWGTKWGMGGYFYLSRGTNHCGVATMASYPTI